MIAARTLPAVRFWLIALFVLDWFRLPEPPLPDVDVWEWRIPVPTGMLLSGVLVGLVLGFLSARLGAFGARRQASKVRRRIRARVELVATEAVLDPVGAELSARTELCAAISQLRGPRSRSSR